MCSPIHQENLNFCWLPYLVLMKSWNFHSLVVGEQSTCKYFMKQCFRILIVFAEMNLLLAGHQVLLHEGSELSSTTAEAPIRGFFWAEFISRLRALSCVVS